MITSQIISTGNTPAELEQSSLED